MAKVILELDEEEASYLDDIISWWIDGYDQAKEEVISDPAISNFDDLQTLTYSLTTQHAMALTMRYRLREHHE